LLQPRQEAVLAALLLALAGYSSQLGVDMVPSDAGSRLITEAIAVALCLRACSMKTLLQRNSRQLKLALQVSLKTAAVVHELKQPLASLLLQCRLLLSAQEQTPSRQTDAELMGGLNALLESAEAINTTLQAMGALLRSVNPSRSEPLNLCAVVQASLDRHRAELGSSGIALEIEGLGTPLWIKGDPGQLGILCDNLLRNATQALQGTPPQQRRLAITVQRCSGGLELRMADSGPGLPTLQLEALQLHSSKADGLGLGLSTAALIGQQHGGCLQAASSTRLGGADLCLRQHAAEHRQTHKLGAADAELGAAALAVALHGGQAQLQLLSHLTVEHALAQTGKHPLLARRELTDRQRRHGVMQTAATALAAQPLMHHLDQGTPALALVDHGQQGPLAPGRRAEPLGHAAKHNEVALVAALEVGLDHRLPTLTRQVQIHDHQIGATLLQQQQRLSCRAADRLQLQRTQLTQQSAHCLGRQQMIINDQRTHRGFGISVTVPIGSSPLLGTSINGAPTMGYARRNQQV